ncbi:Uncharacterized protein dnl_56610 [Desulfonema limicola]|uniref:Uncharacterized protein n=1 Tax=Desulfonema limicola TaxID=45656 RepID=A0A975GJB6_9BACT|nr:hypothetical protein [Desulfonema limicola]QTA83265.1 Uncharacterized protein dnl_56610 [Desulfonema limicola]
MQAIKQILTPFSDNINIKLPKELINKTIEVIILYFPEDNESADREERLLKIYNKSQGILPDNYKFDREEAHEK